MLAPRALPFAAAVHPDAQAALFAWAQAERAKSTLVGITGTAGKTTAKSDVAAALGAAYTDSG